MTASDPRAASDSESAPESMSLSHGNDYIAPSDVLFRDPVLPFGIGATVLGLPLSFRTNSRRVFGMITDAFGPGIDPRVLNPAGSGSYLDRSEAPEALRVHVVVYDGSTNRAPSPAIHHICPDQNRVLIHGAGGIGVVDPMRREALIYASDQLVNENGSFRYEFLEAATLALATHFDRQPVHAAAITYNGRTVLLLGSSGAGKSTLAYLARAAGLTVLSEDMIWVQLEPVLTIWNRSRAIHLLADARLQFPELEREMISLRPNGKYKMAVELEPQSASVFSVDNIVICLLQPRSDAASIAAIGSDELHHAIMHDADAGFDRYPQRRATCARRLSQNGGWLLSPSPDPHESLPLLMELLRGPAYHAK